MLLALHQNMLLMSAGPDTTPNAFSFDDQFGVATSATITSNSIVPAGYDTATAISVSGGTYSINGGAFTAAGGTLNPGDSVRVRHTSSASASTQVQTTLTIGGVSSIFSSYTAGVGGNKKPWPHWKHRFYRF